MPPEWGALSRLTLLALNNNILGGPLPANWSGLAGAKYIGMNGNRLTGQLPARCVGRRLGGRCSTPGLQPA